MYTDLRQRMPMRQNALELGPRDVVLEASGVHLSQEQTPLDDSALLYNLDETPQVLLEGQCADDAAALLGPGMSGLKHVEWVLVDHVVDEEPNVLKVQKEVRCQFGSKDDIWFTVVVSKGLHEAAEDRRP